ncbi:MAG: XdhC family protein [Candidatus Aminicenantales bacterium]|jgi:xanthine dehydrogenase accessory factor
MKYSFPKLLEVLIKDKGLVLATIVEASGSTPQVPGAMAIFAAHGLVAGTVGGGLVEGRAQETALEALKDKRARLVEFRLDADPDDQEGAICGGTVSVLVDPLVMDARPVFERALQGFRKRRPGVLLTMIRPLEGGFVHAARDWLAESDFPEPSQSPGRLVQEPELADVLASGKPRLFKREDFSVFAEPVCPLPRLIIAGAGHVGKAVAHLGGLLDFEVTVIDDRAEFANKDNIPDADTVIVGDIAAAVRGIPDSPENYFVIVTRGHRHDAEALRASIGRAAAYLGLIGSRTKIALVRREFLEKGWATEEEWERVRAPIGLEIRSKTVEEIAVSIAAELVLVRAGLKGPGGS